MEFSNERLNFKHPLWAAASREKGIFAAIERRFACAAA
jgi:hypothetical protein